MGKEKALHPAQRSEEQQIPTGPKRLGDKSRPKYDVETWNFCGQWIKQKMGKTRDSQWVKLQDNEQNKDEKNKVSFVWSQDQGKK